jgi:Flp pilus assembly protein TadB
VAELALSLSAAVGAGAVAWALRERRMRVRTRERLGAPEEETLVEERRSGLSPALRRRGWIPLALGALAGAGASALGLATAFVAAAAALAGVLAWLVANALHERRVARLESGLADAIDLLVAALGAGSGAMEALESAARETRGDLRDELADVVGRIRYGEQPARVWEDLARRLPLEAFRLFTFAMTVHVEVGGSLAPAMATVGRTIRDRIAIGRRVRSQSAQAQASVLGILGISWFLGLLMWRTNPQAFEEFLRSELGEGLIGGAFLLQALGLLWITRLTKVRF